MIQSYFCIYLFISHIPFCHLDKPNRYISLNTHTRMHTCTQSAVHGFPLLDSPWPTQPTFWQFQRCSDPVIWPEWFGLYQSNSDFYLCPQCVHAGKYTSEIKTKSWSVLTENTTKTLNAKFEHMNPGDYCALFLNVMPIPRSTILKKN